MSYPTLPTWLESINRYRAQAALPALQENAQWSNGAEKHAIYMVKNDLITHEENSDNPWYTPEGDEAGRNSNVMISSSLTFTELQAVDLWMQGPFHALGILHPRLAKTGFGIYHENIGNYKTAAVLDVLRGRTSTLPSGISFPIFWPGNGDTLTFNRYTGGEYPDPLTPCNGYKTPTGPPLLVQLGSGNLSPQVKRSDLRLQGKPLPHCIYTETTYTNPDSSQQTLGQSILSGQDAIVIIPQAPLNDGTYTVSITVASSSGAADTTYVWAFSIATSITPQSLSAAQSDEPQTR
ncbi:MAG: CAP domain-containing protein [Thermanaerothrix sp.]|nr:CAP domain-containing protein [Thermanaerothrix sp.]